MVSTRRKREDDDDDEEVGRYVLFRDHVACGVLTKHRQDDRNSKRYQATPNTPQRRDTDEDAMET
jgi:hypothetical protein